MSQANQDQGIQLDYKALEKPYDYTIQAMRVSSSTKSTCHALTCRAVAVGESYDKAYLKCNKQVKHLVIQGVWHQEQRQLSY